MSTYALCYGAIREVDAFREAIRADFGKPGMPTTFELYSLTRPSYGQSPFGSAFESAIVEVSKTTLTAIVMPKLEALRTARERFVDAVHELALGDAQSLGLTEAPLHEAIDDVVAYLPAIEATAGHSRPESIDPVTGGIALLVQDPSKSIRAIARELGVSHSMLCRDRHFMDAFNATAAKAPRRLERGQARHKKSTIGRDSFNDEDG